MPCVARDLYEDNMSPTSDVDEDDEPRSRRSDTPSQAPSYLQLVSDDNELCEWKTREWVQSTI